MYSIVKRLFTNEKNQRKSCFVSVLVYDEETKEGAKLNITSFDSKPKMLNFSCENYPCVEDSFRIEKGKNAKLYDAFKSLYDKIEFTDTLGRKYIHSDSAVKIREANSIVMDELEENVIRVHFRKHMNDVSNEVWLKANKVNNLINEADIVSFFSQLEGIASEIDFQSEVDAFYFTIGSYANVKSLKF